jgi:transposase
MIFVGLTDEQREGLERVKQQAIGRVAMRAKSYLGCAQKPTQMVLLSDRRYPVPFIAEIHRCGCDVVRTWLHRYQARGVAGLEDEPRSGRPPKNPLGRQIVEAQASQSPECSGYVQSCWTVGLLATFLALRLGLSLSLSTVRRYLKAMGWRWARPRLAPASVLCHERDADVEAKLAAITAALELVAQGAASLLYLDECALHLLPVVRAMWMKGARLRVPTPGQNAKHAFFGALDAASGLFRCIDRDRKLAIHFVTFLEQLAAAYPEGPLYLVLDSAPCHSAKVVKAWLAAQPRVQMLWLPKYAAHEANPVERIWGLMKDAVAANRLAGSIAELVTKAQRFFDHDLPPYPVTLPVAA